jgi:hypothetical protein
LRYNRDYFWAIIDKTFFAVCSLIMTAAVRGVWRRRARAKNYTHMIFISFLKRFSLSSILFLNSNRFYANNEKTNKKAQISISDWEFKCAIFCILLLLRFNFFSSECILCSPYKCELKERGARKKKKISTNLFDFYLTRLSCVC